MTIESSEYQTPDVICRTGHPVIANNGRKVKHFQWCGAETISACDSCQAPLPQFTEELAAFGFCTACGAMYRWHENKIEQVKRTMEIAAEANKWSEDERRSASRFIEELGRNAVSASRLKAVYGYLDQKNLDYAPITDAARDLGNKSVQDWLDERFRPLPF